MAQTEMETVCIPRHAIAHARSEASDAGELRALESRKFGRTRSKTGEIVVEYFCREVLRQHTDIDPDGKTVRPTDSGHIAVIDEDGNREKVTDFGNEEGLLNIF